MRRGIAAAVQVGCLLFGNAAAATTAGTSGAPADCEALVEAALAADAGIRAALSEVNEARAGTGISSWLEPPELRGRRDVDTRSDSTRVGLRMALPEPGAAISRAGAARAREARAVAAADAAAARVAAAVRSDVAALRHARARRKTLERLALAAEAHVRAVRARTAAGIVTALSEEGAILDRHEAEAELAEAREKEEAAALAVARWGGRPAAADGTACAGAPDFDIEEAVRGHPQARGSREAAAAAAAAATAARRERWFWPSFFQVSWLREEKGQEDGLIVEAGVPLPLPNRDAAEAAAREETRRFEAQAAERRVRAQIEAALAAHREAVESMRRMEALAETVARAGSLAKTGAAAGADADEIWRLEQRVARQRERLDAARYAAELRAIELRRALGIR